MQYTVSSPEEMMDLGRTLVREGHKKFGLRGELGAGKTHFTKGVAMGLGLDPDKTHSPTYVYFHEYKHSHQPPTPNSQLSTGNQGLEGEKLADNSRKPLLHVDMYRITDMFQIIKIGLEDKLEEYEYRCVERPREEFINQFHKELVIVDISIKNQYTRLVTVTQL